MDTDWDVVVVGRSFAGLSAALALGRMRRSVLVIGSGGPRNAAVVHAHGLLSRDGEHPNEIVAAAEADLAKYPSVELVDGRVTSVEGDATGFRVTFDGRTSSAAKVIFATGVNDDPVPIPGLAEHWGRGCSRVRSATGSSTRTFRSRSSATRSWPRTLLASSLR